MVKFLQRHRLPKLTQEKVDNLSGLTTSKVIELVMENTKKTQLPTNKNSGLDGFK